MSTVVKEIFLTHGVGVLDIGPCELGAGSCGSVMSLSRPKVTLDASTSTEKVSTFQTISLLTEGVSFSLCPIFLDFTVTFTVSSLMSFSLVQSFSPSCCLRPHRNLEKMWDGGHPEEEP